MQSNTEQRTVPESVRVVRDANARKSELEKKWKETRTLSAEETLELKQVTQIINEDALNPPVIPGNVVDFEPILE